MKGETRTIILGGGLAGLAAAYRLKRDYVLLEKRAVTGGTCDTVADEGYRFDRTGHLLHLSSKHVRRTVLGLLDEEPVRIARKSRIFSHGVYTRYPFQANTFGLPRDVVAECLTKFVEARAAARSPDEKTGSFEAFIYRHFGHGIAEHFMIPYNTKLWGVHPRDITADWCTRFVPIPSVEEVVKGAIGLHQERMGYNAEFLYPRRGIEALPAAFLRRVTPVETRTAPTAIDFRKKRVFVKGEWRRYESLITTIPLKALIALLVRPPKTIAAAAGTLSCASLRYLDVALSCPSGTDYHWSYVPEKKYPFYRVGCYSNFSAAMAPKGKSNLYVELSSRRPVRLDTLMPRVTKGLVEMGIIARASDIAFVRPRRIAWSYVVYNHDYATSVPKLLDWLESHAIFSAGRYARWEYAAMEDAIKQGFEAAEKTKDI
jgi:protoporphyrinogen oxidase